MAVTPGSARWRRAATGLCLIATVALFLPCLRGDTPCTPAGLLQTADQRGWFFFEQEDFAAAARTFHDPAWRATALYRGGDLDAAASSWAGLDGPAAAYNRGNALVLLGRYEKAVAAYDRALALRPGWEDARVNRDIAAQRAARLQFEGGQMTGGKLAADEFVFSDKGDPEPATGSETLAGGPTNEETRAIWLRQVETRPGDFLRARFAYELARDERESR